MITYKKCLNQLIGQTSNLYLEEYEVYELYDEPSSEMITHLTETRIKLVGNIQFISKLYNKTTQQIIADIEQKTYLKDVICEKWFSENMLERDEQCLTVS